MSDLVLVRNCCLDRMLPGGVFFFSTLVPVSRSRSSPVPEVVAYFRHGYATVQE